MADRQNSPPTDHTIQPSRSPWQLCFGFEARVTRRSYALVGFSLMLLKYLGEASLIFAYTDLWMTPLDFANPFIEMRQKFFQPPAPSWLIWVILFWSLPFLWVMVSMSIRRALDTGHPGGFGLLTLVPLVNLLVMLVFCILPSAPDQPHNRQPAPPVQMDGVLISALRCILAATVIGILLILISVYGLGEYGGVLFMIAPVALGAISAFIHNTPHRRTLSSSVGAASLSILLVGLTTLLFALEGAICLLMALPLAIFGSTVGAMIGYTLANVGKTGGRTMVLVTASLPLLMAAESSFQSTPVYEVVSAVEIDAPPETVWNYVIQFPPLPEQQAWYFRLGVACPLSATIEGSGVGATRRCNFTTGTFVEPITAWEPARRLAFDVAQQPAPMTELSPYGPLHAPHLDGYLKSVRGEFRLIPLPDGRTRLEGSTWYTLEMEPLDYWSVWTDTFIHLIHIRVLEHIKALSESPSPSAAQTVASQP